MEKPFEIFRDWYEAIQKELPEPTAMTLSTVGKDNRPSSRIVLLKNYDERGFVFYTNSLSRKGNELAGNSHAALNFFWPTLHRQIRIEGVAEKVEGKEADDYYYSRELGKRIGAWASLQSQKMPHDNALFERVEEFNKKFGESPTRPPHWHGYRLKPDYFEFWQEGQYRLHQRDVFEKKGSGWVSYKLYP